MNNLLKKLAEQVELPTIDGEWDYNDREILRRENGEWRVATPSEIIAVLFECEKGREKFAELIVRECARIAAQTPCPYEDDVARQTYGHTWDMACVESAKNIRKHFGVEE